MKDKKITLIIKKISKHGEEGAHGGAWKVAFADFMTAMMAFFLVMWVTNIIVPEKKAAIANYLKTVKLGPFKGAGSPIGKVRGQDSTEMPTPANIAKPDSLQMLFKIMIKNKLVDIQDDIQVKMKENGVRLDIMDPDENALLPEGGTALKPKTKRTLKAISEVIGNFDNKISIEGYTDNAPPPSNDYTNWELSSGRALTARKELVQNGIENKRISVVSGYAASRPLIDNVTAEPRNRRISIFVSSSEQTDFTRTDFVSDVLPKTGESK